MSEAAANPPRRPPTTVTVDLGAAVLRHPDRPRHHRHRRPPRSPHGCPAPGWRSSPTRRSPSIHLRTLTTSLDCAGVEYVSIVVPPGEGIEELRRARDRDRGAARGPDRAERRRARPWRRRGRRSRRLRRRHGAPRHPLRPGADHRSSPRSILPSAARPASTPATARTSSASSISRPSCSPIRASSIRCPSASSMPAMPRSPSAA